MDKKKLPAILVLFPNEWDRAELESPRFDTQYRFFYEGFDLFIFPENARLMWLDARRFIRKMLKKYRDAGLVAVISSEEQFGAMFAAELISEKARLTTCGSPWPP